MTRFDYLTHYPPRRQPLQLSDNIDKMLWSNRMSGGNSYYFRMQVWRRNIDTQEMTYLGDIDMTSLPDNLKDVKKFAERFLERT